MISKFIPFILAICSLSHIDIDSLKNDHNLLKSTVNSILKDNQYDIKNYDFEVTYKPALIITLVDTYQGKKFIKIHPTNEGTKEFEGSLILDSYNIPVIKAEKVIQWNSIELVIQPYLEKVNSDGGILCDVIWNLDEEENSESWLVLKEIYSNNLKLVLSTLKYNSQPARNDRLYEDRLKTFKADGFSGRIEKFYSNSALQFKDHKINWNELLDKKWKIDGIIYQETLRELLDQARKSLSSQNPRWISICHGDWHDMNICLISPSQYAYLDCELSGENEVIGDASVYLVYNSIQGDYLTPKYHPDQFLNWKNILKTARKNFPTKQREIHVSVDEKCISISNIQNFGTSEVRKKVAKIFIENYFNPLLKSCPTNNEEKLKATILMRLLAVYDISSLEPLDQAKIFGFLFKCIGTPENEESKPTLTNFLESL